MRGVFTVPVLVLAAVASTCAAEPPRYPTKVSPNGRFLLANDGQPFFYLGDTAWELFHRLNREDVERYLSDRAAKHFTVIQAVALGELDGHSAPNAYGFLPLIDLDPARPDVKEGPRNDYWDHVDEVVEKANGLGLVLGLLPAWGGYWHDPIRDGKPLLNPANAEVYGEWLGRRYRDRALIWVLGGDRAVENDGQRATIRALARGLRKGDGSSHLMTFHPVGARGSAEWFHNEDWLSFNMRQNGHNTEFTGAYEKTRDDYNRTPVKPVIDAEPLYEDHPISFRAKQHGHSVAADVRRPLYWDLFSGACGHTYGHHSVWQMWRPDLPPINDPLLPWYDALDQPGAGQMQHGRRLIESRPILTRIPGDDVIAADRVKTALPGAGRYRFVATRDVDGTYAMVYAPVGRAFTVHMGVIKNPRVVAWWFNPRTGEADRIGAFDNTGDRRFVSPEPGEETDWVLVLDDASRNYPPPGQPPK